MYIIRDDLGPAIREHTDSLTFKNTILKYWPRNGSNFSDLTTQLPDGVVKDNAHRRIYHVLGMRIKDMEKNPIDGDKIDYTFIHLNAYSAPNGIVELSDIRSYIHSYSPLIYPLNKDKFNPDPVQTTVTDMNPDPYKGTINEYWDVQGWVTSMLVYQPTVLSLVDNGITDSQIIQKIIDISYTDIFYDPMKTSRLTALAMMDINTNSVFQTSTRITSRSVVLKDLFLGANNIGLRDGVPHEQTRYVSTVTIEFKFRRITDIDVNIAVSTGATSFITSVQTRCNALAPKAEIKSIFGLRNTTGTSLYTGIATVKAFTRSLSASVNQQLVLMANWVYPHVDDTMVSVDPTYVNSYYPSTLETQIKISGLIDLPPKQFKKTFRSLMKFDYHPHEKKGHWYDKVVEWVILIIAIVAAVWTAGQSLMLAAFILGLGAIAEGLWAMYLVKNGGGKGSISMALGMSNVLGIASMVVGITAIYNAWLEQGVKELVLKEAEQAAINAVEQGASQVVIDAATQAVITAFNEASVTSISSIIGDAISAAVNAATKIGLINDKVSGILGMIGGSYSSIADIGTTEATSITLETIYDNLKTSVITFVSKPLSAIFNQTINWLQAGFNAYMLYISPPNEGLADKAAQLERSNKEVESITPESAYHAINVMTDPYGNPFETLDTTTVCIMLTTGKNRSLMSKNYDSGYTI